MISYDRHSFRQRNYHPGLPWSFRSIVSFDSHCFLANKRCGIWLLSTPVHSSFVNNGGDPSWLRSKAGQETFIDLLTLKYATNHGVFYIFYYSMYLLCGLFLKRLISKGEKMWNFWHGLNFNCISREPNTRLNFLCKGQSNFMLLSFTLLQLNESVTLPK